LKWQPPGFYTSKNLFIFNINEVTKFLQFLHPYQIYVKIWNILFTAARHQFVEYQHLSEVYYAKYGRHILQPESSFLNWLSLVWQIIVSLLPAPPKFVLQLSPQKGNNFVW
jgi:hypothetical protein